MCTCACVASPSSLSHNQHACMYICMRGAKFTGTEDCRLDCTPDPRATPPPPVPAARLRRKPLHCSSVGRIRRRAVPLGGRNKGGFYVFAVPRGSGYRKIKFEFFSVEAVSLAFYPTHPSCGFLSHPPFLWFLPPILPHRELFHV